MSKFFYNAKLNRKKHSFKSSKVKNSSHLDDRNEKKQENSNLFYYSFALLIMIFVVSIFYVFLITSSSTKSFKISEQEKQIASLKLQSEKLVQKKNILEDLNYIKNKANELGLVEEKNIYYFQSKNLDVAMR